MAESNPVTTHPLEILAQWEGPAIPEPGVLFGERDTGHLPPGIPAAEVSAWLAVTVLSDPNDSPGFEAIRAKALRVLSAWKKQFGQAGLDEVKHGVVGQMFSSRTRRRVSDEALHERIDRLFNEVQG